MKELINSELLKLQEELVLLDTAVKQIEKAGQVSENVVEATKNIHEKYGVHLEKLLQLYNEYLNTSFKHTESNLADLVKHVKDKIKEEEQILEKYVELTLKTDELTHEYIKKFFEDQKQVINSLEQSTQAKLKSQEKMMMQSSSESQLKIKSITDLHIKQTTEVDKLLQSYLELAQSAAQLSGNINKIDFPERFDKLTALVSALNYEQQESNKNLSEIINDDTNKRLLILLTKQSKQIGRLKSWTIFSFVFIFLLSFGMGFMGYFFRVHEAFFDLFR